ncbi:MAG: DUF882 domain-containing protein [Magnetospiraceae bacterium]
MRGDSVKSRRAFLAMSAAGAAAASLLASPAKALTLAPPQLHARTLKLVNLHTSEKLTATYWERGRYQEDAIKAISQVLRDHRNDQVTDMDPKLLDLLVDLHQKLDTSKPFEIISAYRSPESNAKLRKTSRGVAKKSLHMEGRAVDIRIPGVRTRDLWWAAHDMKLGGVGYYKKKFVHVDTGDVRYW